MPVLNWKNGKSGKGIPKTHLSCYKILIWRKPGQHKDAEGTHSINSVGTGE